MNEVLHAYDCFGGAFTFCFGIVAVCLLAFYAKVDQRVDSVRMHMVVVYSAFCIVVFVFAGRGFAVLFSKRPSATLFDSDVQFVLGVLGAVVVLEALLLNVLRKDLFSRPAVIAFVQLAALLSVLPKLGWGIINIVWFVIFSGALAAFLLVSELVDSIGGVVAAAVKSNDTILAQEVLKDIRKEFNGFMKTAAQAFFALGASLGVSMSILFKNGAESWRIPQYQVSAARMVVGFLLVALGLLIWVARPYLLSFLTLRGHYGKVLNDGGATSGRPARYLRRRRSSSL